MSIVTKRKFISGAALGLAASVSVGSLKVQAQNHSMDTQSGLKTGIMKPISYLDLPGFLSAAQIAPHYQKHYGGALKGHLDMDRQLDAVAHGEKINAYAYGAMQRTRTTKGNSALLHEVYFDGMTAQKSAPETVLKQEIISRFGSIDQWQADFVAAAKSANGWAVLSRNRISGKLYNVISDSHSNGVFWQAVPIIALDMYEHAYYLDYQNNKGAYIDKFFDYINWKNAEKRMMEAEK